MKRLFLKSFYILIIFSLLILAGGQHPAGAQEISSDVPVEIFGVVLVQHPALPVDKIVDIVKTQLNTDLAKGSYLKAKVDVLFAEEAIPSSLIVHLLHSDSYQVDIVKISLDKDSRVNSVERDYHPTATEQTESPTIQATCPDPSIQVVLSTSVDFPSSIKAINTSYDLAVAAGYKAVKLVGAGENIAAIQNWLSCSNLIYWGRVGHGAPSAIELYDGILTYSYFQTLQPTGLNNKVLYFNSCSVFNDPLKSSILNASASKYIGGIVPLAVGTSEPVFTCWNNHNFKHDAPPGNVSDAMAYWVGQCEIETGYTPGAHGVGGPGLTFPPASTVTNQAQFVSQNVPVTMQPGEQKQVSITMKNTGTTPWTAAAEYRLGTQNPQDNTLWTGGTRIVLAPGETIAPNQNKTFTFTIKAPTTPGTYNFQWRMLKELVEWFGDYTPNIQITVASSNGAQFVSQSVPTTMKAGERKQVSITLRNTGTTTWTRTAGYRLGSQNPQDNNNWGANRIKLPADAIAPGQSTTFTFNISAPITPGTYNFQWRMVQESVEWFGDYTPNMQITVTPSNGAQFVSQSVPATMKAGTTRTVTITIKNTGSTTWTRAAGYKLGSQNPQDNLRWGILRVELAASEAIAPGQSKTFTITIKAPTTPGTYNFQWRMVQESVEWFGDYTLNVSITVTP